MSYWQRFCGLTIIALAITNSAGQSSQSPSEGTKQPATNDNQTMSITLPNYAGKVLNGPNVDVYERNCLICHSARYVIMQPPFPRSVWEKEVKKMVDAYGATVSEADQRKIVEYLVAVRGTPENQPQTPNH